jgi:hypothetical protein
VPRYIPLPVSFVSSALHVPVNDAVGVGVLQAVGHLSSDLDGILHREPAFPGQTVRQRLPLHEGHDEVEEAIRLTGVEKREDVGMAEIGGGADLPEKPIGPDGVGQVGLQHLDRDRTLVLEVPSPIHRSHASAAGLLLDGVSVGESRPEAIDGIGFWRHGP